jgi:hypothetical protein
MVEFITSLEEMTQKRTSARLKGLASAAAFLVGEHIWWMVAVRLGFARPGVDSTSHSARNVPILQAPVSSAITNDEWDGSAKARKKSEREGPDVLVPEPWREPKGETIPSQGG